MLNITAMVENTVALPWQYHGNATRVHYQLGSTSVGMFTILLYNDIYTYIHIMLVDQPCN